MIPVYCRPDFTGLKEDTGARVEFLLLENKGNDIWEALSKPGKRAKKGTSICFWGRSDDL